MKQAKTILFLALLSGTSIVLKKCRDLEKRLKIDVEEIEKKFPARR